ncbi:MAG: hypothetical protein ACLTYN_03850 [Dysosmobacter welbionis]
MLGAPLGHDFCVISLSDLLTPWGPSAGGWSAPRGDFACACTIPPPASGGTSAPSLQRGIARHRSGDTVCGWVRNIGREGGVLLTLQSTGGQVDMFTTVFVGSSTTILAAGHMVTPRVSPEMNILIFGGTTEGREISHLLAERERRCWCVATNTAGRRGKAPGSRC